MYTEKKNKGDGPMRYLALLGSPRQNGHSAALLDSFLEGAASKGHSGDTIWLHEKKILPCTACDGCKKNGAGTGRCVLKDDMTALYSLVGHADVIVHAFPVYWWSMPAQTKLFQDRLYAMDYPGFKGKKLSLLMTYGGEDPNSGPRLIEQTFRDICEFLDMQFCDSIGVCSGTTPVRDNKRALERAFLSGASL
jgi:multimeric flavodoxin WrbA